MRMQDIFWGDTHDLLITRGNSFKERMGEPGIAATVRVVEGYWAVHRFFSSQIVKDSLSPVSRYVQTVHSQKNPCCR